MFRFGIEFAIGGWGWEVILSKGYLGVAEVEGFHGSRKLPPLLVNNEEN